MITVFNRKELIITFDMNVQAKVRDTLAANGIDYIVRTNRLTSYGNWGRGGLYTEPKYLDFACEYRIYVDRDDYDQAVYLINKN